MVYNLHEQPLIDEKETVPVYKILIAFKIISSDQVENLQKLKTEQVTRLYSHIKRDVYNIEHCYQYHCGKRNCYKFPIGDNNNVLIQSIKSSKNNGNVQVLAMLTRTQV